MRPARIWRRLLPLSSTTGVRMDFEAYRLTRSAKQSPSGEAERTTSPPTSPRLIPEAYGH